MPRAKTPTPASATHRSDIDEQRATGGQLAMVADHTEAQRLAVAFGYTGEISVAAIEAQIRRDARTTAEAALATGAGLLMLKQLTPHGEFTERIETLGFHQRVARRLMMLAAKFSKTDSKSVLIAAAGSQTKLLELAILDDQELDELAQGGTVKGLTLDAIDTLSASELREALREKEAELQVANAARDKQVKRIDKLEAERRRYNKAPADEQLAEMQKRAVALMNDLRGGIAGGLRQAVIEIGNHGEGRGEHDRFLGGLVAEVQHALNDLRAEFGLAEAAEGELPGWLQDDDVAQAAATKPRGGKRAD